MQDVGTLIIGLLLVSSGSVLIQEVNAEPTISCGTTIASDTFLTHDLLDCSGDGIVVGADGITLDCQGHKLSGTRTLSAGVLISNRTSVTVRNCEVENFYHGVQLYSTTMSRILENSAIGDEEAGFFLWNSNNNTISSNKSSFSGDGFRLLDSSNNTLLLNAAINNVNAGFQLDGDGAAGNNTLDSNLAEENGNGVLMVVSLNDTVRSNTVEDSTTVGIFMEESTGYLIYNNAFINCRNAEDSGSLGSWNITKTEGTNIVGGGILSGNYWSDYNGTDIDGDGLGDSPYLIQLRYGYPSSIDYLPLVSSATLRHQVKVLVTASPGGTVSYAFDGGSGSIVGGTSKVILAAVGCSLLLTALPDSGGGFSTWSVTSG